MNEFKIRRKSLNSIEIIQTGMYLPKEKITNSQIEKSLKLEEGYIQKRTGIENRYYATKEKIEDIAYKATKEIFSKDIKKEDIGLIITATTSTDLLMPGISNYIQKKLEIEKCICLDILAGCSGYINALDIARLYLQDDTIKKALVIGVDVLSKNLKDDDVATKVVLSDGAGAILLGKNLNQSKKYESNITSEIDSKGILTAKTEDKIYMNGKEIYKYAVTKTIENINELLEKSNETIENIKSNHLHLGKKIERVRRLRGMTQTELGQLLGITKQAVSKMEQTEKIDDERLEKIASALGVTTDGLKEYNEETVLYNTNNFYENCGVKNAIGNNQTFNNFPIEQTIELFEKLLEKQKEQFESLKKEK